MRRRILWVVIGAPLALIVIGYRGSYFLARGAPRHLRLVEYTRSIPALSNNGQVHYEPGAEDYARDVAALLPDAITRVEAIHRPTLRASCNGRSICDAGGLCDRNWIRFYRSRRRHDIRYGKFVP
jgi:hypothetical protein